MTNIRTAHPCISVFALSSCSFPSSRWRLLGERQCQRAAGPDLPGGAGCGWEPPRWWGPLRGGDRERFERSPGLQHHLALVLLRGSAAGQSERQTAACGELAAKLLPRRPQQEVPHQNRVRQQGKTRNFWLIIISNAWYFIFIVWSQPTVKNNSSRVCMIYKTCISVCFCVSSPLLTAQEAMTLWKLNWAWAQRTWPPVAHR